MTPFRQFLESDYAYDKYLANGATWTEGGCWLLAVAVKEITGGQYIGVKGSRGVTEHVAVWHGGRLIDGDGVSTMKQFVSRWRTRYEVKGADIVAFDPEHAKKGGMMPPLPHIASHLKNDLERLLIKKPL